MAIWTFPPSNGGEDRGINDAGIETFKGGDLEWFLARETIQNSVDARLKRPVKVAFERLELKSSELPGLQNLAETFEACSQFWSDDPDAVKFFTQALKLLNKSKVSVLRISDTNTKGVAGDDQKDGQGWYKLVSCSGASGKASGSGGSFGIGKSAPFAASAMRTVFYSTMTESESVAFRGVARLVSHNDVHATNQPVGYFGKDGGVSIRKAKDIVKIFRPTERGTNLFILGYDSGKNWQTELVGSVLENFWPAIHNNALEVTVHDTSITTATLPELLAEYSHLHKRFHAHQYYRAYTDPLATVTTTNLPTLKTVSVHLLQGDDLHNKIAMIRNTGMVIYERPIPSNVPYCGVFECTNEDGSEILRSMEPPSHDKWDPDRPGKGANRKASEELTRYLRECVKALAPIMTDKVLIIPEWNQYLPDDGDSPEDGAPGSPSAEMGTDESIVRIPVILRKRDSAPPPEPDGSKPRILVPIRDRAFAVDAAQGLYELVVEAIDEPVGPVVLTVSAVGDDAEASPVRLKSARSSGDKELPLPQASRIGPLSLPSKGPLRLRVILAEPQRLALRIHAHEGGDDEAE